MEDDMIDTHLTRRGLIWTGAGLSLVAGGGLITTTCSASAPAVAYAPWALWRDPAARGTPLALVAAGVLAANPHDSQPWLFRVREDAIEIFADTARNLGAMDPFLREMHIGLGCALENIAMAAAANGFGVDIQAAPGSLDQLSDRRGMAHAATVRLSRLGQPAAPPPAYDAIPRRHTNRYPYDRAKGLPKACRDGLAGLGDDPRVRLFLFEEGPARAAYDAAVNDATRAIVDDAGMIADSDRWLRRTPAEIEKYRSGPTLEAAGLSPMTLMMARSFPVPAKTEHEAWLTHTRDDQLATAPLTGFIAVRDRYDRPTALAAGRLWQRLHLAATVAGVAMQPLNQPMEMVDRERQLGRGSTWERRLAKAAGAPDWRATFSFRAGIARHPAPPSPRRALADVVA
jgi:nitroreductase